MTPRERLAGALAIQTNLGDIAKRAGVSARELVNAINARPVNAIAFLRIAAALRFDPCPDLPHEIAAPADFNFGFFALGFRLRRKLNKHSDRQAAKDIDVAPATISRLEHGDVMSIGVVLRACCYTGVHPFGFFTPHPHARVLFAKNVSRETSKAARQPNKAAI